MLFNSLTFLVFFAVVLGLHQAPLPWRVKKLDLLVASYLGPDLLRLRRVYHHGDRRLAGAGLLAARQLPLSLCGDRLFRLLAPLAHLAFDLVARLPLRAAGRQPHGPGTYLREPDAHHVAGRSVARRGVDLRGLGRTAWPVPRGRALSACAGRAPRAVGSTAGAHRDGAADLLPGQHHLGLLPRAGLQYRVADAGFDAAVRVARQADAGELGGA